MCPKITEQEVLVTRGPPVHLPQRRNVAPFSQRQWPLAQPGRISYCWGVQQENRLEWPGTKKRNHFCCVDNGDLSYL